MKKLLLFLIIFLSLQKAYSQQELQLRIDSLTDSLKKAITDTDRIYIVSDLIWGYNNLNIDEALKYEKPGLELVAKANSPKYEAYFYTAIGKTYWRKGNFKKALEYHKKAKKLYDERKIPERSISMEVAIGQDYADDGKYAEALNYFLDALSYYKREGIKKEMSGMYLLLAFVYEHQGNYAELSKCNYESLKISEELKDRYGVGIALTSIAADQVRLEKYPEALNYYKKSLIPLQEIGDYVNTSAVYNHIGEINTVLKNTDEALLYFSKALRLGTEVHDVFSLATTNYGMGKIYVSTMDYPQAEKNFLKSIELYKSISNVPELIGVLIRLADIYIMQKRFSEAEKILNEALHFSEESKSRALIKEYYYGVERLDSAKGKWKDAYFNHKNFITIRDSIESNEVTKKVLQSQVQYEFDKKELAQKSEQEKKDVVAQKEIQKQKLIRNGFIGGFAIVLLFAVVFLRQRNNINKEKKRAEDALAELTKTQHQLVRSEKMAAFGMMASRVAHEIQNPLNFVNNFSDLSQDLVHEMIHGATEDEKNEAAQMLTENLQKINHHSERVENIVHKLLEHTRAGTAHEFFEEDH